MYIISPMIAPISAGITQSIPIDANGNRFCSKLIKVRMNEMLEITGGKLANMSKKAGTKVKMMVNR